MDEPLFYKKHKKCGMIVANKQSVRKTEDYCCGQ